jgi:spermidine synthase
MEFKQPSFVARLISYFTPLKVWQGSSQLNAHLELLYSNGQYMLCTKQACYSYGIYYNPFKLAFKHYHKHHWPMPQSMLLLGGGLLSAAQILHKQHNAKTKIKAIELDATIVSLAKLVTAPAVLQHCEIINADALEYIKSDTATYDCIGVDIFLDMDNCAGSLQEDFLLQCQQHLNHGGRIISNVYITNKDAYDVYATAFNNFFENTEVIEHQKNRIFIGSKPKH